MFRLVRERQVRSVKVGGRRLVPVAALHEWVRELIEEQDDE